MKKSILFTAIATLVFCAFLLAQKTDLSISKRWERVTELAEKQLPESALKEVESILAQAQKEKNAVEVIKAMVYKMRFVLDKNPDEAPALIQEFETFTNKTTDPAECALLHSMTAELYVQYYQKDSWTINQRTEVKGMVPEDMKEWTKNIYFDKISNHLAASLKNSDVLQKIDALKFAALMQEGNDSRMLQPTLFDFLSYRRINILNNIRETTNEKNPLINEHYFADVNQFIVLKPDSMYKYSIENQVVETYQELLAFRLKKENIPAFVHLNLDRLEYFHSNSVNENSDSLYLTALTRLEKQYAKNEVVVEVLAQKASYYYGKVDKTDDENTAFKRKAYLICEDGINRFSKYKRIGLLKNIQKEITKKDISISYKKETPSTSNLKVEIVSSNISKLQLTIYKVNATALEYNDFYNRKSSDITYPNRTLVESRIIAIKSDSNFESVKSEVFIKPQAYGIYDFALEEVGNKNISERTKGSFVVTDLAYIGRSNNPKIEDIYVLNRQSGLPQRDVNVSVYALKWIKDGYKREFLAPLKTDKDGLCHFNFEQNYFENILYFEKGKDCYFSTNNSSNYYERSNYEYENVRLNFFTDRSIYRPGQTVYFKGIAYYSCKKKQEVAPNAHFEVTLYDANNKKVSSKKLTTNEFGSFAGLFVLPEGGLNGVYSIRTEGGSQSIWVEEYKRPTFEVLIDKPKTEIQFGDKVTIQGTVKAFAGYTVENANVKYRVVRRVHHFCWWFDEPEEEITNGTTKSNKDGGFEISFVPVKSKSKSSFFPDRAYSYTIYTDVTDPKGETQQGEQTISVGDKSLFIVATIAEKADKKQALNIDISTETLNGENVKSIVKYTLSKLEDTDVYSEKLDAKTVLKETQNVLSGTFNTPDKTLKLNVGKLNSGRYKIRFTATDAHGKEVELEKTVILYSVDDKRPPVKSYIWMLTPKTECMVGEIAHIQFGTSTKNSMVLYEVMQGNAILESRWVSLSDEIKTFDIPFLESYGAGVTVMFTFMKDEQLFIQSVQLTRKITEKKLSPTLSVFRNKLQPGEKSEWTVTIPQSAKDKKSTELLVGMYDASLDAIRSHSWDFNPVYRESVLYSSLWQANSFDSGSDYATFNVNLNKVYDYSFDQLKWFGLEISGYYHHRFALRSAIKFTAPVIKKDEEVNDDEQLKSQEDLNGGEVAISIADVKGNQGIANETVVGYGVKRKEELQLQKPVQIRTNFNETAFFYPQLRTDSTGNVKFSFTAPESLTRWNVKMLAHTKDLYFGQFDTTAVTQKDLMVQMNLPRFVRKSDKLVLSANVINLTDKKLFATVEFEMIDPATNKPILLKNKAGKVVSKDTNQNSPLGDEGLLLAANETKAMEWELTEFSPYELVICKVVARAGNFSDGEQKYLPVLPDKVLVTESMPLTIRGNQTRTFSFESLLKKGSKVDTKNLSVEFSSNPAWYAVQALPTLSTPENDNALDYFTAYYANSLAAFIANSNPKIATMFDRWKKAGGSRDALLSNLEKNTELKNMLLQETPWVMAAKDETEQKRQIALLFDLNMQKNQSQQYLDKLLKLQKPSGGFAWFDGMPESRYITQEIVLNLGRLNRITGGNMLDSYLLSLTSALHYLDLEIANDFSELKKYNKNYEKEECVGNMQLFYLHVRSEYPTIPIDKSAQEAVKYYTAQSEKYWTDFTLYGKAMMAVVAQRNGKTRIVAEILKSLKENALKTDEFGMYWAKNTSGYFWNERPIAVQAAIIEAFTEVSKNTADVDEMKIWLLKQKQTQRWDSPMSTVDAIYALLNQGSEWLANEGMVKINVGNTILQPSSTEAGTGYFKETIPNADIRPDMGKVTVTKSDAGIGWGAMYWQYYQDLDKVEGQGGPMKITKKLFVEKITSNGKTMLPIEQTNLVKGDKVITRLVINTDRNLEFVALKDLRASCFEPVNQRSGCEWKEGLCYYQTTKDASTQFFFSFLPKGTFVFEYELWANNSGEFINGISSLQCLYAPEFVSHTGGERIIVK